MTRASCLPGKIMALCFLFFLGALTLSAQSARELNAEARKLMDKQDYKGAIVILDKAISQAPSFSESYIKRAYCYLGLGQIDEQYKSFSEGIANCEKGVFDLYMHRATMMREMGVLTESIRDFEQAFQVAESDSLRFTSLMWMAQAKSLNGDFKGALAELDKAVKYKTPNADYENIVAMVYLHFEYLEDAEKHFLRAYELSPDSVVNIMNIGFIRQKLGDYEASITWFNKALALNPDEEYALNNRGYSKLMLHDTKGAMADVESSIALNPVNSYAYRNRGLIYLEMGKESRACDDFDKALALGFTLKYGDDVKNLQEKYCR